MRRLILVLLVVLFTISSSAGTAIAQMAPAADAGPATPATLSSWQSDRPDLPPSGADLNNGEPTYTDEGGSGTEETTEPSPTDEPSPASLDGTGLVTPDIEALAASLNHDPLAIYDYVRNNFEYEPYYVGAVKGTQETLDQMAGNDVDLASLLIALLRAGGTPARYAERTIKVPAADASSWIGVHDPITAARVLASSGLDVTVTLRSGAPVALMFEHVWVEAYVKEGGGKAWKSLDPSYKLHQIRDGRNVLAEAGLTGEQLRDALYATADATGETGELRTVDLEALQGVTASREQQLIAWIEANEPTLTLNNVVGGTDIITESVTKLPTKLPYGGRGSTTRYDVVPDADRQVIRFRAPGLDVTIPVANIASRKITLGFVPDTAEDQAAIDTAGGLLYVSPGSVDMRPQLLVDGAVVAEGLAGPVGSFASFALDFSRGSIFLGQSLHSITAGGTYAVALDTQQVSVPKIERSNQRLKDALAAGQEPLTDEISGEVLHAIGLGYFRYGDLVQEYAAGTQNAVVFHQVSEAVVSQDLVVDNTVSPARMAIGGYAIDVKRQVYSMFDSANRVDFETFPLLYTIASIGSSLEHQFLDLMLGWPGLSTQELLNKAANEELRIQGIGPENVDAVLPTLSVKSSTKGFIQDAVNAGRRVIVPTSTQQDVAWVGDSWTEYNPENGSSGFLLSGGLKGGSVILSLVGLTPEQQQAIRLGDANALTAFLDGLLLGDFNRAGYDDAWLSVMRAGGQIISGIFIVGDIRDTAAAIQKLVDSGLSDGWGDLGLSLIGLIPLFGDAIKAAKATDEVLVVVLKQSPDPGDVTRAFDEVAGSDAEDVIIGATRSSDDGIGTVSRTLLDDVATTTAVISKNGIRVELNTVGEGHTLLTRVGIDPTDGSILNRGRAGEAVSDSVAARRGWERIDVKVDPTRPGIDRVYRDPATGRYKIIEAKFFEGDNINFPTSRLKTTVDGTAEYELADDWLVKPFDELGNPTNDAIQRSVESGSITEAQADQLRQAFEDGLLDKEVVIVKNNYDGRTVSDSLGSNQDLGTSSFNPVTVTVIELGKILPAP